MQNESSTSNCENSKNENETKKRRVSSLRHVLDQWLFLQLLAVFSLSFAVGILFMHGTILWHQYKHGYGYFSTSSMSYDQILQGYTVDRFPNIKNDIYEWSQGRLRVNTSLFVR